MGDANYSYNISDDGDDSDASDTVRQNVGDDVVIDVDYNTLDMAEDEVVYDEYILQSNDVDELEESID